MFDFLKRFYGKSFNPNYIVPYNVAFRNTNSNAVLRIVSDPNLPDLDADGKTVNFYFPEEYMLVENRHFHTNAYHESVQLLADFHKQWQVEKWNKLYSFDAVIAVFENFNRLHIGREWGAVMTTICIFIWYVLDDFFEERLELICKNRNPTVSIHLLCDYITNIRELYENYHLESKPRKWLVFPNRDDEKLWQWVWDVHSDYLERNWTTFNQKIKASSPSWYDILRESYLRYIRGENYY